MAQTEIKENKMGVLPVNKLLINMSLPMMISMLIQALYNIVDSIFVSRISENALTAVSLAFPIQSLLIAFGTGMGVGMNALLSRALGEKDMDRVNKSACNGLFLAFLSYLVFLLVGLFLTKPYLLSQTDDEEIIKYGVQYIRIVCCFSFGIYMQLTFERFLQSTGHTMQSMIIQLIGAVINLIFDPIFIFGYFGLPKMGVIGAAAATVLGQIVSGFIAIFINRKYNTEIKLRLKGFRPDLKIIGRIYAVGFPSIVMQAIGSVMTYCMNIILIGFTSTAAAVFGIYFKIQSFFFMPIFGMNNGMIPIIAYNYGAGKRSRVKKVIKLSIIYAMCIMFCGLIVYHTMPGALLRLFDASDQMIEIGEYALRVISISYMFAGFCIISGSAFQALGNGVYTLIVSAGRQVVVLLPVAFLFSKIGGLNATWWAFPIAEVMSLALSVLFLVRINKKIISRIPDNV